MEKIMSVEDKIRRAEEIYYRRNQNQSNSNNYSYRNDEIKNKKSPSIIRKIINQAFLLLIIYVTFYAINNREYLLSKEFIGQIEEIANRTEITRNTYNFISEYIEKYFINGENKNESEEINNINKDEQTENIENEEQNKDNIGEKKNEEEITNISEENIGGANNEEVIEEVAKTQEEKDIDYIRKTTSLIMPIEGIISSNFGWRSPSTATVPKNHTGLDIAANTGTVIKSATDGKVILASEKGDYGKHYKIAIGEMIIIYAHCSKLYLKEGDNVIQGQNIAEVGSTGNSTRTTFTF